MYNIQQITVDAGQNHTLVFPDGTFIVLNISYKPIQYGWFFNLNYGTFVLNGNRVTNSPNILRQYKNIIPFGLACFSNSTREPTQQLDFTSNYSSLYVLTPVEVQAYEDFLSA